MRFTPRAETSSVKLVFKIHFLLSSQEKYGERERQLLKQREEQRFNHFST